MSVVLNCARESNLRSLGKNRFPVAVLLPNGESFSPYFGGALARWTYEIFWRLQNTFDTTVFGSHTEEKDRYSFPYASNEYAAFEKVLIKVPLLRRFSDLLWLKKLMPELHKRKLLHIHNRPQWVGELRRLGYRGRLVLHIHNDHLGHWTPKMLNRLATQVDLLLTCSTYLKSTFASKCDVIAQKTYVLSNGVDVEQFHPDEELRESNVIFFVGRFDQEKGVLELVNAFATVMESHPHARLVIGGSTGFGVHHLTPYVYQVNEKAKSIIANGGKIEFTGYLNHDKELCSWFQKATIFVCPSIFQEPFGLVNVEAMACATPVVGSCRGGIPEVIGDAGLLVNPENQKELSDALIKLLDSPYLCASLGRIGRERSMKKFHWDVVAEDLVKLLETVFPELSI